MKRDCVHQYVLMCFKIINIVFYTFFIGGCKQELPITATIKIDATQSHFSSSQGLYGISLEEVNHAIEGGLYAELIQNRSFEDGVVPLFCSYNRSQHVIVTPNGFQMPFIKPDSIVGWEKLSANTSLSLDVQELINEKNKRSLRVGIYANGGVKGGIRALGYQGMNIQKDERYNLSFYMKSMYTMRAPLQLSLQRDSVNISDVYTVIPTNEWKKYNYSFVASDSSKHASFVISSDSSAMFYIDQVSLFPEKTWQGKTQGFHKEIMEAIAALNPSFVRFPGGELVNGYTSGTYTKWHQTIGDISQRKHFWSGAGYGVSNGVGFDEFLRLCEDLRAEPIYVVNSGITSQSRRPRYEEIKGMDLVIQETLDAIAYANAPKDSVWGQLRAENGHPQPYNLRYIEIGSDNYGIEYARRLDLFKTAIARVYPEIIVIANEDQPIAKRNSLTDKSFRSSSQFLIANQHLFDSKVYPRQQAPLFISGFSSTDSRVHTTMYHALSEAAFMIGMENNPDRVKKVAYSPLLTHSKYDDSQYGALIFNGSEVLKTPSYYAFQMFSKYADGDVLKTTVESQTKPQVSFGGVGVYLFDNAYALTGVTINKSTDYPSKIIKGEWQIDSLGGLFPAANKWNYLLLGDTNEHDYVVNARIKRTKGSGIIEFRLRDNGLDNQEKKYFAVDFGTETSSFIQCDGDVKQVLSSIEIPNLKNGANYDIRLECADDTIRTFLNNALLHEVIFPPMPRLIALSKYNKENNRLTIKVVNTSHRPEKTAIDLGDIRVESEIKVCQLEDDSNQCNTFENPFNIIPNEYTHTFSYAVAKEITFPPQSITVLQMNVVSKLK